MACFLVPAAEAAIVSVASRLMKNKEEKNGGDSCARLELSKKLGRLSKLLWGGSALLAFEHLWHGEITPYYPFLTAAADSEQTRVMLSEMGTVGVAMALTVTAVWAAVTAAVHFNSTRNEAREERQ